MTVFDFDKTLTIKDTVSDFLFLAGRNTRYFYLKVLLYFFLMVMNKFNFISNTLLKKFGIRLFLFGKDRQSLERFALQYSSQIEINDELNLVFSNYDNKKLIICSASYDIYIKYIYPNVSIISSQLSFDNNDRCDGLNYNLYGTSKVEYLNKLGIKSIQNLYTDSYSDKPLMCISDNVFLVNHSKITKIK